MNVILKNDTEYLSGKKLIYFNILVWLEKLCLLSDPIFYESCEKKKHKVK